MLSDTASATALDEPARRVRATMLISSLVYGAAQRVNFCVSGLSLGYGGTLIRRGEYSISPASSSAYIKHLAILTVEAVFPAYIAIVFAVQSTGQMFDFLAEILTAKVAASRSDL
jgi:hypothetical protein